MDPYLPEAHTTDLSALRSPLPGPPETLPSCLSPHLWLPLFLCLSLKCSFCRSSSSPQPRILGELKSCTSNCFPEHFFLCTLHVTPTCSALTPSVFCPTLYLKICPGSPAIPLGSGPTYPPKAALGCPHSTNCSLQDTYTAFVHSWEERQDTPVLSPLGPIYFKPQPKCPLPLPKVPGRAEGTLAAFYPT